MLKKLYNNLDTLVEEALEGQSLMYAEAGKVLSISGTNLIVRQEKDRKPKGLVKLAMGYGSGHEGPGAGSVRPGGMDLGIPGDIFADRVMCNESYRRRIEFTAGCSNGTGQRNRRAYAYHI